MKKITLNQKSKIDILSYEKNARQNGHFHIAGVDEAGRGPLAGPVVACACILPEGLFLDGINDSKKLTPEAREDLFRQILGDARIFSGIGIVHPQEIDEINILQATFKAMRDAIENLPVKADYLLVDGPFVPTPLLPAKAVIKGDSLSQSIMAASIIAKCTRDALMKEYDKLFPLYGFAKHKGYGTAAHLRALHLHGPCEIHRKSFAPVKAATCRT